MTPPTVQVYGAGRVGLAVARLAVRRGLEVTGMWNPRPLRPGRAELAADLPMEIGGRPPMVEADLWLLAVPDAAIHEVAGLLAAEAGPRPVAAAHTAGAHPASLLEPLAAAGIACGSWHPAMAFRGAPEDAEALASAVAAIEGTDPARRLLRAFTAGLGLSHVDLAAGDKPRYHAALVLASNGRVALDAAALELLAAAGIEEGQARVMLDELVRGTEGNLRAGRPADVQTGPVARGDARTVFAELEALADRPDLERLYRSIGTILLDLVPPGVRGPEHAKVARRIR